MGLKKNGVEKSNSRLQDSGLFGIIEKITPTNHTENTALFPISMNHKARRLAVAAVVEAEYYKAQAITLTRRMSIR